MVWVENRLPSPGSDAANLRNAALHYPLPLTGFDVFE